MKAVLIHGLLSRYGGRKSLGQLVPFLEEAGFEVELFKYGFWGVLRHYFGDIEQDGKRCAEMIEDADLIITHSHGAVMMEYADKHIKTYHVPRVLVQFSPAQDMDKQAPYSVVARFTLHTRRDGWVRLARYLPFSRMGGAGCYGYDDPMVDSYNIDYTLHISSHSAWFSKKWREVSASVAVKLYHMALAWEAERGCKYS